MPWEERSVMSQRLEFVEWVGSGSVAMRELCRRFGIGRDTAYRLWRRYQAEGAAGLCDRSRRPHHSPGRVSAEVEAAILAVRRDHPAWGGRKIAAVLRRETQLAVPAPSTITEVLRRHGALDHPTVPPSRPWQRFERAAPNDLWQMDFKGHFPLRDGARCHPLTVLDDHSRFNLLLHACPDEQRLTVQATLVPVFARYGLPDGILTDNGSPWGYDADQGYTRLSLWLMRLGVAVLHGRPYHPQTQGKDERFHRSLDLEVLRDRTFTDLSHTQSAFDHWRHIYNHERPHEALNMATPSSRFRVSPRPYPKTMPPLEYPPGAHLRRPDDHGDIRWRGGRYRLGKAFRRETVALLPTQTDGVWDVSYARFCIARLDERAPGLTLRRRLDQEPPLA